MVNSKFLQEHKVVHVGPSANIASFADLTTGNPATDIVNMSNWGRCTFIIIKGAGAVGTATITVESCDTVVPGTATPIPFYYRKCSTIDTFGEWTFCGVAGFTMTAGADQIYEITVDDTFLYSTNKYVRLQFTEVDSTATDGAVTAILTEPRHADYLNSPTAIV